MSAPYNPYYPGHYPPQYYQTPYYPTPQPSTPFVPSLALYNSSPWARVSPLPPVSPYLSPPRSAPAGLPFPSTESKYEGEYISWGNVGVRERRPSLNDGPWLQPSAGGAGHNRRHSFHAPKHWTSPQEPSFHLNPWINAESPRFDFHFDLSRPIFSPVRLYGGGQSFPLSKEEMMQPATYPSIFQLRITCDELPKWPIELEWSNYTPGLFSPSTQSYHTSPAPISLTDVLVAIHQALHQQIRHSDWAELNSREQESVGRAYTARCKAAGTIEDQDAERAKGVKRVDFLGRKTRMVGLTRSAPTFGWENMKLHTR